MGLTRSKSLACENGRQPLPLPALLAGASTTMAADDTITFELAKTDKALTGPVVGECSVSASFPSVLGEEHYLTREACH